MIIPSDKDSWIVCGAQRTGSFLISEYINNLYKQWDLNLRLYEAFEYNPSRGVLNLDLIHTHQREYYQYINENIRCIIPIRDIVESCLSQAICPRSRRFHFYKDTKIQTIVPFVFEKSMLIKIYKQFVTFYETLDVPAGAIIIDYKNYSHNVDNLANLIGIEIKYPISNDSLPIKTPGSPEEWFINWTEIQDLIKDWETDPTKFICC